MDSETGSSENGIQDGLHNAHNPISRDPEPLLADDEESADESSSAAQDVNEAVGPAEEKDQEGGDDRELTTEISPSD